MENYRQGKEEWEIEHLRKAERSPIYQLKEPTNKPDSTTQQAATMKQKSRSFQRCSTLTCSFIPEDIQLQPKIKSRADPTH